MARVYLKKGDRIEVIAELELTSKFDGLKFVEISEAQDGWGKIWIEDPSDPREGRWFDVFGDYDGYGENPNYGRLYYETEDV